MFKLAKAAVLVGMLSTLTACTGHVQNTKNNCSYDYLLHPAISISKIIGGCGPATGSKRFSGVKPGMSRFLSGSERFCRGALMLTRQNRVTVYPQTQSPGTPL